MLILKPFIAYSTMALRKICKFNERMHLYNSVYSRNSTLSPEQSAMTNPDNLMDPSNVFHPLAVNNLSGSNDEQAFTFLVS